MSAARMRELITRARGNESLSSFAVRCGTTPNTLYRWIRDGVNQKRMMKPALIQAIVDNAVSESGITYNDIYEAALDMIPQGLEKRSATLKGTVHQAEKILKSLVTDRLLSEGFLISRCKAEDAANQYDVLYQVENDFIVAFNLHVIECWTGRLYRIMETLAHDIGRFALNEKNKDKMWLHIVLAYHNSDESTEYDWMNAFIQKLTECQTCLPVSVMLLNIEMGEIEAEIQIGVPKQKYIKGHTL